MTVRITDEMLIFVSTGAPYTVLDANRVRRILAAGGIKDVELHRTEIEQIADLRLRARLATQQANAIEARGPMPACTCKVEDHIVVDTYGCPLGHKPNEPLPEPVE